MPKNTNSESRNVGQFPCDVCSADKPIAIEPAKLYMGNQNLYTCGNCGFVYVRERRSALEIAESWSKDIFQKGYTARIPYVLARQTYVADYIDTTIGMKGKSLCDIGAGEGQFLEICRDKIQNMNVYGIEPSDHNVGILKKQDIPHFHGTIEQFRDSPEFGQRKFDIVTMMWTLENCLDCNLMIQTAYEMTKEGGHIVLATGSRLLVPFKKPLNSYLSTNPADTHAFRFSANSIYNILSKNQFSGVFLNRYTDGEYLVAIGKKKESPDTYVMRKDDPKLVVDFFNRWHADTQWYIKNNLLDGET